MKTEDILNSELKILNQKQREFYFEYGYLLLESIVDEKWLEILRNTTNQMIEKSKEIKESNKVFDLEKGHNYDDPRLRRLSSPNDHHINYWKYASEFLPLIISDLVGPDVKFHHSKLNFKWSKGGEEVKWHQDIQFWPHTNYSPCTVGTYLYDCSINQGPLGVIPKSHKGPLYDQYENGKWTGNLSSNDEKEIDINKAVYLDGLAGSVTIHNCRTVHGSKPNNSDLGRPLLLNVFSSADAMPYTKNPLYSKYDQKIILGKKARWAYHDPRPCLLPPDWSSGYKSIFSYQQQKENNNG